MHRLGVRFFIRVVAVRHTFATDPALHEEVCFAAASGGGLVLCADAAVEDDVDTAAPVLLDGKLVLGERAGAFVRGIRAVEREVEAVRAVKRGRCGRGRLAVLRRSAVEFGFEVAGCCAPGGAGAVAGPVTPARAFGGGARCWAVFVEKRVDAHVWCRFFAGVVDADRGRDGTCAVGI